VLALLVAAAFAAGLVDSIAGGGGILTLPALLASGLDPAVALATNKGQAVFGSVSSLVEFGRKGQLDRRRAPWSFAFALLGAVIGARLVLRVNPAVLRPAVLVLLLMASVLTLVKKPADAGAVALVVRHARACATGLALVMGLYDGFFGPGTGTLLLLTYAYWFGDGLVRASANAKVANAASNLGALALFAVSGTIRWDLALPMGVAQLAGAVVGTRLTIRAGGGIVRVAAIVVGLLLAARVAWQLMR
jgi:uncharacterized membrane protein YfcA